MKKKAVLGLPFSWLFAIIVGAFIIFLAIYFATRLITTQEKVIDTATAKKLTIIFDPLEIGLASGKSSFAEFSSETIIYNNCEARENSLFGNQKFAISARYGIRNKWSEKSEEIIISNKYVFSEKQEQGKTFYFFSKPFEFPFKVSEIIFLSADKYCFVNPPDFIEEEAEDLKLKNVQISNGSCIDKKVCFNSNENCDINVVGSCVGYECENIFDYGYVTKNNKKVYYYKSLIYAAIFSDSEVYECNVKRLMKRTEQLSYLYYDEANFLASKGCGAEISTDLLSLAFSAKNFENSGQLILMLDQIKLIDSKNSARNCETW